MRTWTFQEHSMIFPWNKKVLKLCFKDYICRGFHLFFDLFFGQNTLIFTGLEGYFFLQWKGMHCTADRITSNTLYRVLYERRGHSVDALLFDGIGDVCSNEMFIHNFSFWQGTYSGYKITQKFLIFAESLRKSLSKSGWFHSLLSTNYPFLSCRLHNI